MPILESWSKFEEYWHDSHLQKLELYLMFYLYIFDMYIFKQTMYNVSNINIYLLMIIFSRG